MLIKKKKESAVHYLLITGGSIEALVGNMFLDPNPPPCLFQMTQVKVAVPVCSTQTHSPQFSQHTDSFCIKKSKRSKCVFIFFHIETYIKYLPHVEEISEAEFIVTALNTSKRSTARSLGDAQLLPFSERARPAWRRAA